MKGIRSTRLKCIKGNGDVLLVDAQEAADPDYCSDDAAILIDDEIADVANLMVGRIADILLVVNSHSRILGRYRRHEAGWTRSSDWEQIEVIGAFGAGCVIGALGDCAVAAVLTSAASAAAEANRIITVNSVARLGIEPILIHNPTAHTYVPIQTGNV